MPGGDQHIKHTTCFANAIQRQVDTQSSCGVCCLAESLQYDCLTVVLLRPTLVQPLQRLLNRLQNGKQPFCSATSTTTRMSSWKSTLISELVMHQKVKVSADKPTLPSDGGTFCVHCDCSIMSCPCAAARMCCCSVHCQICSIDAPSYVFVCRGVCVHVSDAVLFLDKRALCHCNADYVYLLVDGKAVPFDASESLSRHKRDKLLLVRKWLTVAYTALCKPDQPYLSADEQWKQ